MAYSDKVLDHYENPRNVGTFEDGHTLIHTHTGSIADVDITQSGVNDNYISLTTSGDNADIDISQTD